MGGTNYAATLLRPHKLCSSADGAHWAGTHSLSRLLSAVGGSDMDASSLYSQRACSDRTRLGARTPLRSPTWSQRIAVGIHGAISGGDERTATALLVQNGSSKCVRQLVQPSLGATQRVPGSKEGHEQPVCAATSLFDKR